MRKFLDIQLQDLEHNHDPHHFHAACASGMAPATIKKNRIILVNVGQRPKSAIAYPVVVMTETTWNDAWQKAWDRPL